MSDEGEVVTIESLASGGAGVTHLADGMIAFVPRTAPGDQVRLRAVHRRRRHAEAQIAEILTPGPGRTEAPCEHFTRDRCGGCQWQHLTHDVQAAAKTRIIGDALRRIGKLDLPDPPLVSSPRDLGYRTTITLTVRRRGAHTYAGFHDAADPDRVFKLESCAIARPEVNELWHALSPLASRLPPGDDVRLKLRVAPDGSRHVIVTGGEGAWTGGERIGKAIEDAGLVATIWWHPKDGALRRMAGAESDPASAGFEQVNAEVAGMLRDAVIEETVKTVKTGETVLDLYAGAGDTALPLAKRGLQVTMVEMDARAVRRAEDRTREAGLTMRCIAGQVEDHLEKLLPASVVIVNPPRTGLDEAVTARLARLDRLDRLIYVSCDPATLARDLRRLNVDAGQIATIRAYDMFPQTSHVETLVVADRPSVSPSVRP